MYVFSSQIPTNLFQLISGTPDSAGHLQYIAVYIFIYIYIASVLIFIFASRLSALMLSTSIPGYDVCVNMPQTD